MLGTCVILRCFNLYLAWLHCTRRPTVLAHGYLIIALLYVFGNMYGFADGICLGLFRFKARYMVYRMCLELQVLFLLLVGSPPPHVGVGARG